MRSALIDCVSILVAVLSMHLAVKLLGGRMPQDKHHEDKTWSEFMATQLGMYHPTVMARYDRKVLFIAILVGLITFVLTNGIASFISSSP